MIPEWHIHGKINEQSRKRTKKNSHLGRVPLKIPAGQHRGRPARDGLARRLAPGDRLAALPLGGLGLGPGHWRCVGGKVVVLGGKEVGGGFGLFVSSCFGIIGAFMFGCIFAYLHRATIRLRQKAERRRRNDDGWMALND